MILAIIVTNKYYRHLFSMSVPIKQFSYFGLQRIYSIYNQDKEISTIIILSSLLLLDSSFMIFTKELQTELNVIFAEAFDDVIYN